MIAGSSGQGGSPTPTVLNAAGTTREITSEELLAGGNELNIRHGDDLYRLRRTSKGKLILTK